MKIQLLRIILDGKTLYYNLEKIANVKVRGSGLNTETTKIKDGAEQYNSVCKLINILSIAGNFRWCSDFGVFKWSF